MAPIVEMATGVCTSCGAAVDGKFCAECGARLDASAPEVATKVDAGRGMTAADEEVARKKIVDELMHIVKKEPEGPKPGLSNDAKAAKDALVKDPYNMDHIFKLGMAYAHDEQWTRSANVLLRGWKRVKEIVSVQERFEFLVFLCQGSMNLKKHRQALAVLEDIEVPLEFNAPALNALKCQVYCANGDAPRGMKAFHDAIAGQDFDQAAAQWAICHEQLVHAGLAESTKTLLKERVAASNSCEEDCKKLDLMESIIQIKAAYKQSPEKAMPLSPAVRSTLFVVLVVFIMITVYALYVLEKMSLKHHRIEL